MVLIAANGFFVASEFALVASERRRLETLASEGSRTARLTLALLKRLSFHLSGAQLGITITSLVLGTLATSTVGVAVAPIFELLPGVDDAEGTAYLAAVALLLATVIQMVLGELVPKNLAISRPEGTALALARPTHWWSTAAGPAIGGLNRLANAIVRRLGVEPTEELRSVRSLEEIEFLIRSSGAEGVIDRRDLRLLTRTLRFTAKDVGAVLVPRGSMVAVATDATAADAVAEARRTGRSRVVVFDGDRDHVVGQVDVHQLLALDPATWPDTSVRDLMTDVVAVPESLDVDVVVSDLLARRQRLVVAVDEHGSTAGLLTLEDLVEELVGDITDEHDTPAGLVLTDPQRPGRVVLDGGVHIDDAAELAGIEIPDGDYETLAGFVLWLAGRIPDTGDTVTWDGFALGVVEMDGRRVSRVAVERGVAP